MTFAAPVCSTIPLTDQDVVPVAVPLPPRLLTQVTCVTPTLSEAVPPMDSGVDVTDVVALVVGVVIWIAGAVASLYVTVSVFVPWLPAASRAVTVSTLLPGCSVMPLTVQLPVPE